MIKFSGYNKKFIIDCIKILTIVSFTLQIKINIKLYNKLNKIPVYLFHEFVAFATKVPANARPKLYPIKTKNKIQKAIAILNINDFPQSLAAITKGFQVHCIRSFGDGK